MKKIILSVIAVAGVSVSSFGQGVVLADNSTSKTYDTTINNVINTSTDLNLELLIGTSAGSVTTDVVTLLLSNNQSAPSSGLVALGGTYAAAGDISTFDGLIYDNSGAEYNLTSYAGDTVYLEIEAWTGAFSSYAAASAPGSGAAYGTSQVFTSTVASTPTGFAADVSNVQPFNVSSVPEPGTMALAGLGSLSLFLLRRKK